MENPKLAPNGEKKPRLMISKMELENFKSYAGVQAIGPFHKCFSSIVGPNGSGKSNVIDALLFVFGARAKQLRLNKVSELVHKSSLFPSLDYARVSIYFQLIQDDESHDENFEVIPGSEFTVSRVAYANNTSKYTIDNRTSSFTEVGQLLRGHGVDLDNNRFLILQGEVEQIAMMKPKGVNEHEEGLLEYLEDIIGSNQYVPQIDEASKALDVINEQRLEKVHRLKVAEKERDNLYGSKMEAEQYLDKEKQLRQRKNILYQIYAYINARNIADFTAKLEGVNAKLTQEKAKLTDSEDSLKKIEKEYDATKAEHAALEAELLKASTAHDSFERKDVKVQEDLRHTRTNLKKHQTNLAKEEKKLIDAEKEVETLLQQITKTENVINDFTNKKAAAEEELNAQMVSVNASTQHIRVELEQKQQLLAQAEKQAGGLFTDRELVMNDINIINERVLKVEADIEALTAKLAQLQVEKAGHESTLADLQQKQDGEHQRTAQEIEKKKAKLIAEEVKIQEQIYTLVASIESNKEIINSSKSINNRNKTIQAILQAARCGSLTSVKIIGRLGDLASIQTRYDVAINTACKYLDYIVVQSTEDAQQIISYLRESNLGRASFIVLDQMQEYIAKMDAPYAAPSREVRRLFDLLQDVHSTEVRGAFYMALGNTLVADDLDTAVGVAYNNKVAHRVVTLAGQLIDTSGAMSGGGNEVKKGGMRLTNEAQTSKASKAKSTTGAPVAAATAGVTEEFIQQQEAQLAALQEQSSSTKANAALLDQQAKQIQFVMKQTANEIEKIGISISHIQQQEVEIQKRIGGLQAERNKTRDEEQQLRQLQSRLADLDAQIAAASPNLKTLQQEVNSLQRQILSYGGLELSKINNKIDSYTAQIDQLSANLAGKRVEYNNNVKAVQKAQAAIDKCNADIEKMGQKLAVLETEQAEMATDAKTIVTLIEEYKRKLSDLEEDLQRTQAQYSAIKSSVSKIKAVEVDLQMEVERLAAALKEETGSKNHYAKEIATLKKLHLSEYRELRDSVSKAVPTETASAADSEAMDVEQTEGDDYEALLDYSEEDLSVMDAEQIKKDINVLEAERNKLKGNVNMNALIEYLRKDALYKTRLGELEAITAERAVLLQNVEALRAKRLTQFMQGFSTISLYLKEMYQMLTLGGDAELELIDSLDPFTEGIIFSVRPVKKSWKSIFNLSGGEKTLASLALVFALHYFKPTPLYVMDEIDAALDFKNVSIVANYIKERTKNAQFIIISLRNNMFELADRLVGIYKTNDHTKSITISPKLFSLPGAQPASEQDENVQQQAKGGVAHRVPLGDATNKVH